MTLKFKKAQAAMEFLMTYGWAILVILVALGVLFYLGVFSPKTSNSCQAAPPIVCNDVKVNNSAATGSSVILGLSANGVDSANVGAIGTLVINAPTGAACASLQTSTALSVSTITPIQYTGCTSFNKGNKFSGSIPITYTLQGSSISHATTVTFSGTVE